MGASASVPATDEQLRRLHKDEQLRNSVVVRAFNRRGPAVTLQEQLLAFATKGNDKGGDGKGEQDVPILNVEILRTALGLDARSNAWFDERLRWHLEESGGIPTTIRIDELCRFMAPSNVRIRNTDHQPYHERRTIIHEEEAIRSALGICQAALGAGSALDLEHGNGKEEAAVGLAPPGAEGEGEEERVVRFVPAIDVDAVKVSGEEAETMLAANVEDSAASEAVENPQEGRRPSNFGLAMKGAMSPRSLHEQIHAQVSGGCEPSTSSEKNVGALRTTMAMDSVMHNPEQIQKNIKLAEEAAPTVQNLFKILLTSTGNDEHFKKLEFGINQRRQTIQQVIGKADKDGSGLPLLVPVSLMLEHFPKYFMLDEEHSTVTFSAVYDHLSNQLQEYMKREFEVVFNDEQIEKIHALVATSVRKYSRAMDEVSRFALDESIELVTMTDKTLDEKKYLFQPVTHDGSVEEMLLDGEECNRVLMETMGDNWEQVDMGHGMMMWQINESDVQKPFPPCRVVCPGVKSVTRVREKANFKYKWAGADQYRRVRDYARLGFRIHSIPDLLQCIKGLHEKFTVLQVENRFRTPTSMGWRDVSVLVLVDLPTRGQHIAEIQLQLEVLAVVRETEHAAYEEIRSFFSTDEMIQKQDEIMRTIQSVLDSPDTSMGHPVGVVTGAVKIYFRSSGVVMAMAERQTFETSKPLTGKKLAKLLPPETNTPAKYFTKLVDKALSRAQNETPERLLSYMFLIVDKLRTVLFNEESGLFKNPAVCFQEDTGIPARCSSREVPRTLSPVLPSILKTDKEAASKENIRKLAACTSRLELEDTAPTIHGADWHVMDWEKPAERGILIILQGVTDSAVHHFWSCAEKGGKLEDGRFFKEANVEGISWTLQELAEDVVSVRTLVICILLLGGV